MNQTVWLFIWRVTEGKNRAEAHEADKTQVVYADVQRAMPAISMSAGHINAACCFPHLICTVSLLESAGQCAASRGNWALSKKLLSGKICGQLFPVWKDKNAV